MTIIKFFLMLLIIAVGVTFFTLYRNDANLLQPPGVYKRLSIFMTTHTAHTADDHEFAELRTPVFDMGAEQLFQEVLVVGSELGWGVITHDSDELNANFIVRSPVFLFEDDVFVQVRSAGENRSSLFIESSSRNSGADFAANSGHIQLLVNALKTKLIR